MAVSLFHDNHIFLQIRIGALLGLVILSMTGVIPMDRQSRDFLARHVVSIQDDWMQAFLRPAQASIFFTTSNP